jgi:large subunit ribosomal protein L21
MFAIINISGKQYKTSIGSRLKVPRQTPNTGSKIIFDNVLLTSDEKSTQIGDPNIKGATVTATILSHARDKKILIYKKKRRKGYQRKNGHRQWYTEIQINDIKMSKTKAKTTKSKTKVASAVKAEKKQTKKRQE